MLSDEPEAMSFQHACVINDGDEVRARKLSLFLGCGCVDAGDAEACHAFCDALQLWVSKHALTLRLPGEPHSFQLDYTRGRLRHRLKSQGSAAFLVRAMGKPVDDAPFRVWDLTGGFAEESLLLAKQGYEVHAVEHNPWVYVLLDDALASLMHYARAHAGDDAFYASVARWSLRWSYDGALHFLQDAASPEPEPDAVYLDPMFPERSKQAKKSKVKKKMQVLQALTHAVSLPETDWHAVLQQALLRAKRRVVVKRPLKALPLAGIKPQTQIITKLCRYDVYLVMR